MRRRQETRNSLLVKELNRILKASGLKTRLSNEFIKKYSEGAGEIELVRSGLDDTMVNAYQAMVKCGTVVMMLTASDWLPIFFIN